MARKGSYGGRTLELSVILRCDNEFSNRKKIEGEINYVEIDKT